MSVYDVAIIGAGPAGSVAAIVLARAGLDIALIDRTSLASNVACRGETLSPAAAPVLARLKLTDRIELVRMPRVTGFVSRWGSMRTTARPAFIVPDAASFSLDRSIFDAALRMAAADSGATVLSARVVRAAFEGERWCVTCSNGTRLHARFAIDASGRGARFARRAGARLLRFDKLVAITSVFTTDAADRDCSVMIESACDGWWFSTKNSLGDRVVSFFTDADLWPSRQLARPQRFLDMQFANTGRLARYCGANRRFDARIWPAATLALAHCGAPGMLAIGDAAQTCDPLSSQGISAAMEDAESAALLLVTYFERDLSSAIDLHEARRRQRFLQYLSKHRHYYRAETRWPDQEFWRRRHDLGERIFSTVELRAQRG